MVSYHSRFTCLLGVLLCAFQLCAPMALFLGLELRLQRSLLCHQASLYRKGDLLHYNVIKWKRILRYCLLVGGIHPSTVDSLHKGTVIRTLDVSVLFVWTKCWTNSLLTGDSRRHNQSGRLPKVVAFFSATNFSSYIIELLQVHDTIRIEWNYAWIQYDIAIRSHLMV